MAESGLLIEVRWEWDGTEVTADALLGATSVTVLQPGDLTVDEDVWISGTGPYTLTAVDEETGVVEFTPGLAEDIEETDPVVPDAGGVPGKYWVAEVVLQDSDSPIEVPLVHTDLLTMPEGVYDPPVAILVNDTLDRVLDLPNQTPLVPSDLIDTSTIPTGNAVYSGPTPPWPELEPGHPNNDIWYDTSDNNAPHLWDSTNMIWVDASDPKVDLLDDISAVPVGDTTVGQIAEQADAASLTATSARNLASSADGRVSFSDYDPTPADMAYYVYNPDGTLARGTSWRVYQAELVGGVADLTLLDAGMTMAPRDMIVVSGVGAPFDGEWRLFEYHEHSLAATEFAVAAGTVTITVTGTLPWVAGHVVNVSGVDAAVDGVYALSAVTATTVSYVLSDPIDVATTPVAAGTVASWEVLYKVPNEPDVAIFDAPDVATGYNTTILSRIDGSVWFTRTRARLNLLTNPSFEADLAGWTAAAASPARVQPTDTPVSGTWAVEVTNDAAAGDHTFAWAGGSPGMAVSPGETYSATAYARGAGTGVYASLRFYDAAGVLLDELEGPAVDLDAVEWQEVTVTGTAPESAAFMAGLTLHNPGAGSVWQVDGALIEAAEYTGRYFDGDSYDGLWLGTAHGSESRLVGGKIITVWELYDNGWSRLDFTGTTAYDADAGDLTKGFLPPERIADNSISVDKMRTNSMRASEALAAGDIVSVWDNNGLFFVQKASALVAYNLVPNPSAEADVTGYFVNGHSTFDRSSDWASDGLWSFRHVASGTTNETFMSIEADSGAVRFGLKKGLTYTASCVMRLTAARTVEIADKARRIVAFTKSPTVNGGAYVETKSGVAPNEAGVTDLSVTFTVPADATEAFVRIYNGGATAGDTVWVDSVQVTETDAPIAFLGETELRREAHGFVLQSCAAGDEVPVYTGGYNPLCAGLLPGTQFLSTTPGKASPSAPSRSGRLVQRLGFASDDTTLHFQPMTPIKIV